MTSAYSKSCRYKKFSVHTNTKKYRFQIVPLWRAFSKSSVFVDLFMRISVDGRRIRNNKVAFSNLSGIVWTGPRTYKLYAQEWRYWIVFVSFKLANHRTSQQSAVSSEYEAKTGLTLSNIFQNNKLEKIFLYKTISFNMVFSFKQLSLLQAYFFMFGSCQNNVWTGSCIWVVLRGNALWITKFEMQITASLLIWSLDDALKHKMRQKLV